MKEEDEWKAIQKHTRNTYEKVRSDWDYLQNHVIEISNARCCVLFEARTSNFTCPHAGC